jgi:hypothetical protein
VGVAAEVVVVVVVAVDPAHIEADDLVALAVVHVLIDPFVWYLVLVKVAAGWPAVVVVARVRGSMGVSSDPEEVESVIHLFWICPPLQFVVPINLGYEHFERMQVFAAAAAGPEPGVDSFLVAAYPIKYVVQVRFGMMLPLPSKVVVHPEPVH